MSRREIRTEAVRAVIAGRPALVSVPVIPADAVGALREGLRRRRHAARTGACVCGATRQIPPAELGRLYGDEPAAHTPFPHPPDCAAHQDRLGPAIQAWQRRGRRRHGAQAR